MNHHEKALSNFDNIWIFILTRGLMNLPNYDVNSQYFSCKYLKYLIQKKNFIKIYKIGNINLFTLYKKIDDSNLNLINDFLDHHKIKNILFLTYIEYK